MLQRIMSRMCKHKPIRLAFVLILISQICSAAPSYRINNGTTATIDEHSNCQNVTNASGTDLFVPTNLSSEWLSFRTNLPTGVSLSACTLMTNMTEPPNAVYGLGAFIDFQVTWNQNITVTGTPRIVLNIGGVTRYATYTTGSGSANISFRYVVQAGDNDSNGIAISNNSIDLNGGTINDGGGNGAQLNMTSYIDSLAAVRVNTSITPPNQVTGVTLAPTSSATTLGVSWSVPNDNGTPLTNYVVQYRQQGNTLWNNVSPNPTTNVTQITGLTAGITYEVRVAASNGVLGPYSAISTAEIFNVLALNPIVWLDGSDPAGTGTPPANGSLVGTWVNKAGTGSNATEGSTANQPTYLANVQNGMGALRFVELDQGLEGTFTRSVGNNLTMLVVVQFDNGFSDRCVFEFRGPGNSRGFFIDQRYGGNNNFSPGVTKGQFNLYTIRDAGGSAIVDENTTNIYNGTVNFNTDFTGTGNYTLGDDTTGNNRLNGYIGEFLIFDEALSATDIAKLKNYLQNKWGTP